MKFFLLSIITIASQLLLAAEFNLVSDGYWRPPTIFSDTDGEVQLRNFRLRVIARDVYGHNTKYIHEYLNNNNKVIEKSYVPNFMNESASAKIHGLSKATRKLTILLTADAHKSGSSIGSYFLFAEDLKIGRRIKPHDHIRISISEVYREHNNIKIEFTAAVNRNDGRGFTPIEFGRTRYLTF